MSGFVVRPATRDDCPGILAMIQEVANYEQLPDAPKIGIEVLQRDGFDTEFPLFKCFVAELKDKEQIPANRIADTKGLVGYAMYYMAFSSWTGPRLYLQDLYVVAEVRQMKVGSTLFDKVVKVANDSGCNEMDFMVLNWNPAIEFYKRKGAVDLTVSENWHRFRLGKIAIENISNKEQNK